MTNIFTNKSIDKKLNKINSNVFITKEGLLMTLLSKKEFLSLCKKHNLKQEGDIIEYIKNIETGKRSIIKVKFKRL